MGGGGRRSGEGELSNGRYMVHGIRVQHTLPWLMYYDICVKGAYPSKSKMINEGKRLDSFVVMSSSLSLLLVVDASFKKDIVVVVVVVVVAAVPMILLSRTVLAVLLPVVVVTGSNTKLSTFFKRMM